MKRQDITDWGVDLSTWRPIEVRTDRLLEGESVKGLVFKKYRRDSALGVLSLGQFLLNNAEIYRAWGVEAEPHCSFHQVRLSSGEFSSPLTGCPEVSVDAKKQLLTIRAEREEVVYPVIINQV